MLPAARRPIKRFPCPRSASPYPCAVLEVLRRGRRWGTAALVLLVGAVFVVFIGIGTPRFSDRSNALIEVAGRGFSRDEFLRARAEQEEYLRRVAGDAYDAGSAEAFLDQRAAEAVVSRGILVHDAERLGLGVSREELRAAVRSIPGVTDASGNVDRQAYERLYTYEYGNEAGVIGREDLTESIVGGLLRSEHEASEMAVRLRPHRGWEVVGSLGVHEFEDLFSIRLPRHRNRTVGGLVVEQLGTLPQGGERVVVGGLTLEVVGVSRGRVMKVLVCFPEPTTAEGAAAGPEPDQPAGPS